MASMKCGGDSFPERSDFYPLAQKIEAMTANTRATCRAVYEIQLGEVRKLDLVS